MTGPQRRRLHRVLAGAVQDAAEAAGHLAAGADEPNEDIAAAVEKASWETLSRGAPARAAALAEAAVSLSADPAGLPAWQRRVLVLRCLEEASEVELARTFAEKWTANVPDEVRGELTFFRGILERDPDAMFELLGQAIGELDHQPAFAAHVGALLADKVGAQPSRLSEGRAHAERAVRNARRAGAPEVLRWALAVEGDLAARAGEANAEGMLRAAVALPGWKDMWVPVYSPEMRLAWWHLRRGELVPARQLLHAVLAASKRSGREWNAGVAHCFLTVVEWAAGRWDEAEQYASSFDRYVRVCHDEISTAAVYAVCLVAASRGHAEHARAALGEAVHAAERERDPVGAAILRGVLGRLELSVDDPAAAVAWLDPIAAVLDEITFGEPGMVTVASDLVEAYALVGRTDEAAERLQRLQEEAARRDNPWACITSSRAAAILHLALGDSTAAVDAVTPAVAEARELALRLELGRCLLVLGTAQRRTRRRRAAATSLGEAIGAFSELGAPGWAGLAKAQRARLAHSSDDLLTPSEQRIAELVSQGRTNAEIAAALCVKTKTVEANLTRIYRKLGVRSRVELARRVAT